MDLRYWLPRQDLREYVRAYYFFASDYAATQPVCAELANVRILLNGRGRLVFTDGRVFPISSAFVIGPTNGAYIIDVEPGTQVFGIGVRPKGWGALLGMNAARTADQVYDLRAVAGPIADYTIDEIMNARDLQAMATAADRFFAMLATQQSSRQSRYPEAFAWWLTQSQDLNIDGLIDVMDISRRQTDRVAKQFFGASPKLLQRKFRALRAADRIRAGAKLWSTASADAFYDQSHYIKEFKSFIGVTPGQFAHAEASLISKVQSRRKTGAGSMLLASI